MDGVVQMPEWFVDNLDIRILDVSLCTHMLYMCVCVCVFVCGADPHLQRVQVSHSLLLL